MFALHACFKRTLILLLAVCLTACAGPLDGAKAALAVTVSTYDAIEPKLEARRRAEGAACLELRAPTDETCLAEVRTRWVPIERASTALYGAIVAAVAAIHAAETAAALGQKFDVAEVTQVVLEAVKAGDAFAAAARPANPAAAVAPGAPAAVLSPGGVR
jgi:hypothetical protein